VLRSLIGALAALLVLGVTGCENSLTRSGRIGLKLPPSAFGASVNLQQHLTVDRDGRTDEIDAALEIDPERVDMVGLMLGQRVLALHYDGTRLETWRHPMMPEALRGEDVLEDLQLTLWPAKEIRDPLPAGWRIEESDRRRTILEKDVPVTVIQYSSQPRWSGTVELQNLRFRYRLTIRTASAGS
jgi:Protein of unknown function (DUF3261)